VPPVPVVPTIAVVGGGASGSITTVHTIRSWADGTPLRIVMYDARGRPGRGVAYGTDDRSHLLNVPAARMSALADEATHFLDWLATRDADATAWTFAPRATYGEYLTDTLMQHAGAAEFVLRERAVSDLVRTPRGFQVRSGHEVDHVDAVVLATGNSPPAPLVVRGVEIPDGERYVADPWQDGAIARARALANGDGVVLLVGSGLTSVDVALSLSDGNPTRLRVVCVSRHGLLPRRHVSPQPEPWPVAVPDGEAALSLRDVEKLIGDQVTAARASGADWRAVIDGLRPHVSTLWRRLPIAERRRFLAGPARLWDVHRHRMAPAVGAVVAELMSRGCLEVRSARLADMRETSDGWSVALTGPDSTETIHASVVVNCTGPAVAGLHGCDQLLTRLVARGLAHYDALGLGVQTDNDGRVVGAGGVGQPDLFAIGPLRRGELWESTAVPEIRQQAAVIGVRLTDYLATAGTGSPRSAHTGVAP